MRWKAYGTGLLALVLVGSRDASAADDARISEAINRGVAYLRGQQKPDGSWPHPNAPGATAMAGLALLECGAAAQDPAVQKAAAFVRQSIVEVTQTYSIATTILFLDRLHESADDLLIQTLAVRLLRGQQADNCWGYECAPPTQTEVQRLRANLRARSPDAIGGPAKESDAPFGLPKEIEDEIHRILHRTRGLEPITSTNRPDHSNTQFAVLALWVARRHGVPVEVFLRNVDRHFRSCQGMDGGWGYISPLERGQPEPSTLGATCAGLLGLTLGHASSRAELRTRGGGGEGGGRGAGSISRDPAVRSALLYLGSVIGPPVARKITAPPGFPKYYYPMLWSLERVGVVYGLTTIGDRDWYAWGCEMILASQEQDGAWHSEEHLAVPDTCFAVLFLKRSNLVQDLTDALKGKVKDPGKAFLRGKGVGGGPLTPKSSGTEPQAETPSSVPSTIEPSLPRPPQSWSPSVPPARPAESNTDAARLVEDLAGAPPVKQPELIDAYKDRKGNEYTEALGEVIGRLEGETRERARDALAERLTRMSAATLRDKLKDANPEVRSAACLAIGMREDRSQVPDLIPVLLDREARVWHAARVALKSLSGEDFGPFKSTAAARREAITRWQAWWVRQQK